VARPVAHAAPMAVQAQQRATPNRRAASWTIERLNYQSDGELDSASVGPPVGSSRPPASTGPTAECAARRRTATVRSPSALFRATGPRAMAHPVTEPHAAKCRVTEPHVQRFRDREFGQTRGHRECCAELGSRHVSAHDRQCGEQLTGEQLRNRDRAAGARKPFPWSGERATSFQRGSYRRPGSYRLQGSCRRQGSSRPQAWRTAKRRRRSWPARTFRPQACRPACRPPIWRRQPGLDADRATLASKTCTFGKICTAMSKRTASGNTVNRKCIEGHPRTGDPQWKDVRRRPTLPRGGPRSTIGAERLSFRVRNGTGRFPLAMTAVTLLRCQSNYRPYPGNCTVDA
jgi:hypothetical protein